MFHDGITYENALPETCGYVNIDSAILVPRKFDVFFWEILQLNL